MPQQFFDPIGNKCLCETSACAFTDTTRDIGNYTDPQATGTGNSGSGTAANTGTRGSAATQTSIPRQQSGADRKLAVQVGLSVALGVLAVMIALWA